jgi:hypothetical protein
MSTFTPNEISNHAHFASSRILAFLHVDAHICPRIPWPNEPACGGGASLQRKPAVKSPDCPCIALHVGQTHPSLQSIFYVHHILHPSLRHIFYVLGISTSQTTLYSPFLNDPACDTRGPAVVESKYDAIRAHSMTVSGVGLKNQQV